jgi:hypothetical protein
MIAEGWRVGYLFYCNVGLSVCGRHSVADFVAAWAEHSRVPRVHNIVA